MIRRTPRPLMLALALFTLTSGCRSQAPEGTAQPAAQSTGASDAAFTKLVDELLDDYFQRNPTTATYLGIHTYDDKLEDLSRAGIDAQIAALRAYRDKVSTIDAASLSLPNQLDREQLLLALDSQLLTNLTIKPWAINP